MLIYMFRYIDTKLDHFRWKHPVKWHLILIGIGFLYSFIFVLNEDGEVVWWFNGLATLGHMFYCYIGGAIVSFVARMLWILMTTLVSIFSISYEQDMDTLQIKVELFFEDYGYFLPRYLMGVGLFLVFGYP